MRSHTDTQLRYIREFACVPHLDREPPTLEEAIGWCPEDEQEEFADWWCEFTRRHSQREKRRVLEWVALGRRLERENGS